jgi:hypothetical protein
MTFFSNIVQGAHGSEPCSSASHVAFDGNAVQGSTNQMATKPIIVQQFSVTSAKSFQDVASRLEAAIGHPDMSAFRRDVTSAKTYSELEKIVNQAIGPSGFMEFASNSHCSGRTGSRDSPRL